MIGLTLRHRRGHVFRCLLEAIAFGVRHNLEAFGLDAGAPVSARAVGGGTQSELLVQLVSDVTGIEQLVPVERIGASYGDARLAAEGAGLASASDTWMSIRSVVAGDPDTRSVYDLLYRAYRDLYPATRSIAHAMAELQLSSAG